MKKILFLFWQFTWGIIQSFVGLIFFAIAGIRGKVKETRSFRNSLLVILDQDILGEIGFGGVSLGGWIFVADNWGAEEEKIIKHEYGHSLQSLVLGPFYFLVIGIPSACWNQFGNEYRRKNNVDYYDFYCEKWANHWGGVE